MYKTERFLAKFYQILVIHSTKNVVPKRNYAKSCIDRNLKCPKCPDRKAEDFVCEEAKKQCPLGDNPCVASKVKMWRNASLFFAIPAVILLSLQVFVWSPEHSMRGEFITYEYMYRRLKRFPWGCDDEKAANRTLFHNLHVNPLPPCGYENVDPCIDPCDEFYAAKNAEAETAAE